MARTERNDVDYFPFYCKEGKTMFYIEQTYQNDGFSVWVKILRALARTNYHYISLYKNTDLKYLASKCLVDTDKLIKIINDLVEFEEFDAEFWKERKVIWSKKFCDSVSIVYDRRSNKMLTREQLCNILGIYDDKGNIIPNNVDINTQTILKETIPNQTKENKSLIDIFFNDLENSCEFERVSRELKIEKSELVKFIPLFRPKANLEYPKFIKFVEHFKNYVNKEKNEKYAKNKHIDFKPGGAGQL